MSTDRPNIASVINKSRSEKQAFIHDITEHIPNELVDDTRRALLHQINVLEVDYNYENATCITRATDNLQQIIDEGGQQSDAAKEAMNRLTAPENDDDQAVAQSLARSEYFARMCFRKAGDFDHVSEIPETLRDHLVALFEHEIDEIMGYTKLSARDIMSQPPPMTASDESRFYQYSDKDMPNEMKATQLLDVLRGNLCVSDCSDEVQACLGHHRLISEHMIADGEGWVEHIDDTVQEFVNQIQVERANHEQEQSTTKPVMER